MQPRGDRAMLVLCSPLHRFTNEKKRQRSKYIPHVGKENTEVLYREKRGIYGDLSFVDPMLMKNTSYAFKMVRWKERTGVVLYSGIQRFSESNKEQRYIQL